MSSVSHIPFRVQPVAAAVLAGLLASCGGGGGSPTPTPSQPANTAPQFTSGTTATVAENSTGTVYTATGTDADGDALSFTISGGADATAFTLAGGALSFVSSPNYDRFADAGRNNVYEVTLRVADGRGGTATRTVNVTVTNDREGIAVTRVATGLGDAVSFSLLFGSVFAVAESDGTVSYLDANTGVRTPFVDLALPAGSSVLDIASDSIGGVPLPPVVMVREPNAISLRSGITSGTPTRIELASGPPGDAKGKLVLSRQVPGLVHAAVGDPGGDRAQGSTGYGKLFEVVLGAGGSVNQAGKGIRQPGGWALLGNDLVFADRGGSREHELDFFFDSSTASANLGWPFFEGTVELRAGAPAGLEAPDFTYAFGDGPLSGTGVVMGALYQGVIASLNQHIVFADSSGKIWSIRFNLPSGGFENRTADFAPDAGTIDEILKIVLDQGGRVHILDADGELFRVDPA